MGQKIVMWPLLTLIGFGIDPVLFKTGWDKTMICGEHFKIIFKSFKLVNFALIQLLTSIVVKMVCFPSNLVKN